MVVWVFAGGGEAEVRGLIPFLQRNYAQHQFERKSPVRLKPGPKPIVQRGYGLTGKSLAHQLTRILQVAFSADAGCDVILVIDDLDCHDPGQRRNNLNKAIDEVRSIQTMKRIIGFAAPEVEAWIIADWEQTIAQDADFRDCNEAMRWWMSTVKQVSFRTPETFSAYDPNNNACAEKLSEVLIEATKHYCSRSAFSKAIHTPRLLEKLSAPEVSRKCPLFRDLHTHRSYAVGSAAISGGWPAGCRRSLATA